jgi:hypothetical protein
MISDPASCLLATKVEAARPPSQRLNVMIALASLQHSLRD